MLTNFKDEDFDNKIKKEDVSVIQFSAEWCGPCKALKPVMDKLSDEYKDKAGFYYADVEDGGIKYWKCSRNQRCSNGYYL